MRNCSVVSLRLALITEAALEDYMLYWMYSYNLWLVFQTTNL